MYFTILFQLLETFTSNSFVKTKLEPYYVINYSVYLLSTKICYQRRAFLLPCLVVYINIILRIITLIHSDTLLFYFNTVAMLAIIFATLLLIWIYIKAIKPYSYWKDKGVFYVKPWPLLGNMAPTIFRKKPFAHHLQDLYSAESNKRYV